jgi:hypothetical protein
MTLPTAPGPGTFPVPAPSGVLEILYLVATVIATVPVSLALGWPVLTLVAEAIGRGGAEISLRRLAAWLARQTPGAVVLAIGLMFPPFLLGIVLHGEAVLGAAAQMAWLWLAVVPLAFLGVGSAFWVALRRRGAEPSTLRPFLPDVIESYILAFRRRGIERAGAALTGLCLASLFAVGFVFVAHDVLVARPELWGPAAGPPHGFGLPLRDPELLPRLLFALLGALALSGFSVGWHGADRVAAGEEAYGRAAVRFGMVWFTICTGLELLAAGWLVLSLPAGRAALAGGGGILLWTALGTAVASVLLAIVAAAAEEPRQYVLGSAVVLAASLVTQAAIRERIRDAALAGIPDLAPQAAAAQPGFLVLFAVVAVLGAAVAAYLLWATSGPRRAF